MQALSTPQNCCSPCPDPIVENYPGTQGKSAYQVAVDNGFVGDVTAWLASLVGEDGQNAYTALTAQFIQPAVGATVVIAVASTAWMSTGVELFIESGGYYELVSIGGATAATVRNRGYTANVAPAVVVPLGAQVIAAGEKGETGEVDANGALLAANNLNDVPLPQTALGNLGGTTVGLALFLLANPGAVRFLRINALNTVTARTAAEMRTDLVLVPGTDVQAYDAGLGEIAALAQVANRLLYLDGAAAYALASLTAFARTILDDADAAASLVTLGRVKARRGLLGSLTATDMNTAGDTLVPISATRYRVDLIILDNTSATLAAATAGVFSGAGGIGTIAADQTLAAATTANKHVSFTLSGLAPTDTFVGSDLYFRVGTPAGIAATANIFIFGEDLS